MTIKEYAKARGVSYEAVRQTIKRHAADLEGHITVPGDGRAKQLDEEAIELLDLWRGGSPYVIMTTEQSEEVQRLRAENDALKNKVMILQEQLLNERQGAASLAGRVAALEAAALPGASPRHWWQRLFGGR